MKIDFIYTGLWKDYSREPGDQLTLTVSNSTGALLIAVFALFVAFVGSRSWEVIKFTLHQLRAQRDFGDGLSHQSQALLASPAAETPLATGFLRLFWAWRVTDRTIFLRTIPFVIIAAVHFSGIIIAGIFSSQIALHQSSASTVLLKKSNCGVASFTKDAAFFKRRSLQAEVMFNDITKALQYADDCYEPGSDSSVCDSLAARYIDFKTTLNVSCPFPNPERCCFGKPLSECHGSTQNAIQFNTGLIDSLTLGHNAPFQDRILYRKLTTCSPIHFFPRDINVPGGNLPSGLARWISRIPSTIYFNMGPYLFQNSTYIYHSYRAGHVAGFGLAGARWAAVASPNVLEMPAPDFRHTNGDVSMVFLAPGRIGFAHPVDDPVFKARLRLFEGKEYSFLSTYLVSAIGCVDQHQICNMQGSRCSPLAGARRLHSVVPWKELNPWQAAAAERLMAVMGNDQSMIGTTPTLLGPRAIKIKILNQRDKRFNFVWRLPANQWVIETQRWFSASLANLQLSYVSWASKHESVLASPQSVLDKPTDPELERQCHQQVVRVSGLTQSFSILGMAILFGVGMTVVSLSFIVKPIVAFFQKDLYCGDEKHHQYVADGLWQIQKTAFEYTGRGEWTTGSLGVPIPTVAKAKFRHLSAKSGKVEFANCEEIGDV